MAKRWNELIKELREEKNLSQDDLAKMLNISKKTLYRYECGTHEPPLSTFLKMSNIFGVSLNYLVGFESANISDVESLKKELRAIEEAISKMIRSL